MLQEMFNLIVLLAIVGICGLLGFASAKGFKKLEEKIDEEKE